MLWAAMFLVGSANGFVEIGINPLTTTIYPKEKTHMLNVLHAWWPGGLYDRWLPYFPLDQQCNGFA